MWLGTAPEALFIVPVMVASLVAVPFEAGPLLGDLLFVLIAATVAILSLVVQAIATWRWQA